MFLLPYTHFQLPNHNIIILRVQQSDKIKRLLTVKKSSTTAEQTLTSVNRPGKKNGVEETRVIFAPLLVPLTCFTC